ELDDHAPAVFRIAQPADEALLLERVEPARHRAGRQVRATGELAGAAAVRLTRPAKRREHVPVAEIEAELVERLLVHPLDAPVNASDAVDDALDREVEVGRQVGADLLEKAIDVIAAPAAPCPGHVRSVHQIPLDVKIPHLLVS